MLLGAAIGIGTGAWLGQGLTGVYAGIFRFPVFDYRLGLAVPLVGVALSFAAAVPRPAFADSKTRVSGPHTHENLAVYFIHGASTPGPVPLTLQEALDKGSVRVLETGTVNELKIENTGEEEVFIQSGDIVKGGKQDRVLRMSFVLPPKSGNYADLQAIISYLRTLPGDPNQVPDNTFNFTGKAVKAFLIKPMGPLDVERPKSVTPDSTEAYGDYLVNSVSNCAGCHTTRDLMTGAYAGPRLAGWKGMEGTVPGTFFNAPNLTPDPETGHLSGWDFEVFRTRFRAGAKFAAAVEQHREAPAADAHRADGLRAAQLRAAAGGIEQAELEAARPVHGRAAARQFPLVGKAGAGQGRDALAHAGPVAVLSGSAAHAQHRQQGYCHDHAIPIHLHLLDLHAGNG